MVDYLIPLIWFLVIAFGVVMYVLLDGFVLGVGILFAAIREEPDRDTVLASVAPVWDGNETWLVLGGVSLFAAFPVAYSVVLPALYLPLTLMVLALVFRGAAIEFRPKAQTSRYLWNRAFMAGSIVAAFTQGIVLGTLVQGIPVAGRQYVGGPLHWLTPFALMTGAALVAGYALLGATWLVMKTEGPLQSRARRLAARLTLAVLAFMAAVSAWVPFLSEHLLQRWFAWPNVVWLAPLPLASVLAGWMLWRTVNRGAALTPFLLALSLFLLAYLGLAYSIWPHIVPPALTIWQAASPPESQFFLLVGVLLLIPVILGYTAYSYWVFRGKVGKDAGYR